jgi:hypothetical protein
VTTDLIKQLCTALEIEYALDKDEKPNNEIIKELSKKVIKEVKSFKKENEGLSDKFYSLIMTDIGNWGLPLVEKITYLHHANKTIMDSFIEEKKLLECRIDDTTIGKFVKARNSSTHGNNRKIEQQNANFTYLMKVMVYVLIIKRLGFEEI